MILRYRTLVTAAEHKSEFVFTTAIKAELWGVYCEEFEERWLRYNGTALYSDASNLSASSLFLFFF